MRGQGALGGQLAALETLIRPHVSPVSVSSTIGDTQIIEVAMDRFECSRTIKVEDNVGVSQ